MSRAPLVLSAAVILCASSFLALADERNAISSAAERSEAAAIQKSAAKKQEHEYRLYRHYRATKETPSAMIVSSHPVRHPFAFPLGYTARRVAPVHRSGSIDPAGVVRSTTVMRPPTQMV
jgi:hypothetical protein